MKKKYYDNKTMAKTLLSIAYLMKLQLSPFNRLLTAAKWESFLITSDEYVDQRPNQMSPSTHSTLTIVQSTPLVWQNMTQQTQTAATTTHTTSLQTPKMTALYAISV